MYAVGRRAGIRTVELDPDRAPLVAWAFEVYAMGDYSLLGLLRTDRQGTEQPGQWREARTADASVEAVRDADQPYYMGIVTYRGVQYPGKHPAVRDARCLRPGPGRS